jgi:phage terminase small subunit
MATLSRDEVIAQLQARGVGRDRAVQYADQFCAYQQASANIAEYGTIIKNPRTGQAVKNPYLAVRDAALKALRNMQDVDAAFLW